MVLALFEVFVYKFPSRKSESDAEKKKNSPSIFESHYLKFLLRGCPVRLNLKRGLELEYWFWFFLRYLSVNS